MKASELIAALQDGIKMHGDLPVEILERDEEGWTASEVATVTKKEHLREVFELGT